MFSGNFRTNFPYTNFPSYLLKSIKVVLLRTFPGSISVNFCNKKQISKIIIYIHIQRLISGVSHLPLWNENAPFHNTISKLFRVFAQRTSQKIARCLRISSHTPFVVPCVFTATWRLYRFNQIVRSHFVEAYRTRIGGRMNLLRFFMAIV